MTETDFRTPFVGHLPGYPAENERTAPGRPVEEVYSRLLLERWRQFIDSEESRDERLVQAFLERHPCLLPGSHTVDGDSGHSPYPMAVISQPKLPGLSDRHPDFMWIAVHSTEVFPILIEIETPHKQWLYGDRAEIHSDLAHAQGQLAEWRAWFDAGYNRDLFIDQYGLRSFIEDRKLSPRFVLIHGRSENYTSSKLRRQKQAQLARNHERIMSFDRLTPCKNSVLYSCVRREADGYRVIAVPPSLTIFNFGDGYQPAAGWHEALDTCADMAVSRREYLKEQLALLVEEPDAYYEIHSGGFRTLRARWL
ncbi:Shedu anti-phage system protein SduA domain-containing protein [Plantactinospora mayteni]|uniref:Shedu anti-phage system protein SduA domain-containing protein n=1 Tax=Plantactinospora mayteni TaxID=566021 RepID=UPI001944F7A4|nr:Shedu anti-phage system protein SduA domain-containing protein [Plantactinospora mayteni]